MMNKKVFIFDIDGTLLNSDENVQECHIKALIKAKAKNHELVLCSGRSYEHIFPILKQMPKNLFRYLICNNGAYIHDLKTNKKIIENSIDISFLETLEKLGEKYKTLWAVHTLEFSKRGRFWKEKEPEWFKNVKDKEWHVFEYFDFSKIKHLFNNTKITQVTWRTTKEIVAKMLPEVKKAAQDYNYFVSGKVYIDILPKGVSKLSGIAILCKILDTNLKSCIAFGDSGNDIEMLKGVGYSIAPKNATKEAKEVANIIIGDHNTCALADKLLELI